jgi:acyl-CoA reductase-like NAD-dependent aldehyde dehydrogenase
MQPSTPTHDRNAAGRAYISGGTKPMLIGGRWEFAQSGKIFEIVDPATGGLLCTATKGDTADVDRAVVAARRAFEAPSWGSISPYERAAYLLRTADLIAKHADELATIQAHDMGMLIDQARDMAAGAAEVFRYYAGWVTKIYGRTFPARGPGLSYTVREALGVVGAIIPWNGPLGATAWKIAPALACGNTIVFKPATQAPLVSLRMAELLQEAGLPDGVVNMVTGSADVGAAMVVHPGIDKISFTGSTEVGKHIIASGAETMKKVTLELGGKSPTIIFPDADLDKAVAAATTGFSIAAGQGCVAGSRVLIHENIYDEVAAKIATAARQLKVGSPFDPLSDIPPIVSQQQLDRIMGYIKLGQDEGGRLTCGGQRIDGPGYFVEPTVFADARPGMRIVQEEIFGPVGALLPFSTMAEAIRLANDVDYGLSASIWTKSIETAQTVSAAAKAGIVWVNSIFELDPMAPFGGYKQSGLGRELGPDSIEAYTQIKTVVMRF